MKSIAVYGLRDTDRIFKTLIRRESQVHSTRNRAEGYKWCTAGRDMQALVLLGLRNGCENWSIQVGMAFFLKSVAFCYIIEDS